MVTYNTRQKQLVYDFIVKNKEKQFTCDEVTFLLSKAGTPVGKTTVYRQLEKLSKEGAVRKVKSNDSQNSFYQYIDSEMNCSEHLHLRCTRCGEYVHLGCDFMSKVSEHIFTHHNFTVDNSHTEILGICGKCSSERAEVN